MQAVDGIPDSWEGGVHLLRLVSQADAAEQGLFPSSFLSLLLSSSLSLCLCLSLNLPVSVSQSACLCAGEGGASSQPPLGNPSWARKVRAPRGKSGLFQEDPEPYIFSAGIKGILEPVTRKGVQSRNLPSGEEQIVGREDVGKRNQRPETRGCPSISSLSSSLVRVV